MKKMPVLVLMISLAMSSTAVQAKDSSNDKSSYFSTKKTQLTCDRNNCWDSHSKSKADQAKNKKKPKYKPFVKVKKDKKQKPKIKPPVPTPPPPPVQAVPEINAGGAAMALLLAGALILTLREKHNNMLLNRL